MTYQETLSEIYGLGRFGMKPGLDRISSTLSALNNPQNFFAAVHVVGTNGKGSTASLLASILARAGYVTGLFTSPHLLNFTERIRVNDRQIDEGEVVSLFEQVRGAAPADATFFELVTAMACLHFAGRGVEVAVVEAGMGGRFDATNALQGLLTVVTPISIDHSQWLGSDLLKIAAEKAGIIKKGAPVVTASQQAEVMALLADRCRTLESRLYCAGGDFHACWRESLLSYRGMRVALDGLRPGIQGRYQAGNAACALAASEVLGELGFPIDRQAMAEGVERAAWPGRMEILGDNPRVLLDGAHNPAGALALADALSDIPRDRLLLVIGVMADKDLDGILTPLLPFADEVIAVSPRLERSMPAAELAAACRGRGVAASSAHSVASGLATARASAGPHDLVLVCGSLFLVGEARGLLLSGTFEPFSG